MRNEGIFKLLYDEALSPAKQLDIDDIESRLRKISCHLDDNPDTYRKLKDKFEFERRFNQDSRQNLC